MTTTTRYSNLIVRPSERTIGVAVYDLSAEAVIELAESHLHRQAAYIAGQVGAVGYEFDTDLTPELVALGDEDEFRLKWRISVNPPLRLFFTE